MGRGSKFYTTLFETKVTENYAWIGNRKNKSTHTVWLAVHQIQ